MDAHDRPVGLSVWEEELYDLLVGHVTSEADALARYEGLAESSTGHVRFLLQLIAEDEARHHRMYEQWAETVRDSAVFIEPEDGGVPRLERETDPADLIAAVDDLLEVEKKDAQQLKTLEKKLKDVRRTTVWPLLTELMALDTQKHVRILEFLRDHATRTARRG